MDDILIKGGQVIDGTGEAGLNADVGIQDGRITFIGDGQGRSAHRIIDAGGMVVTPGFIDIHTHSDFTLPLNPLAESKVRQGVTTEVIGNCGYSTAPALPGRVELLKDFLAAGAPWLEFQETTFNEYLNTFPTTSVNVISQVGHAALRLMSMGMEEREPTQDELAFMIQLLKEALDAGALGMSCGLFTAPGNYAKTDELLALAKVLKGYGATYASHIRDEANHGFEAVREAIAIGEATGVRVQIAHLKLSGIDNWGRVEELLSEISAARHRGVDVNCDQYPYTAGTNPLRNLLPVWVQKGGVAAMLARLQESDVRDKIRADVERDGLTNFGRIESWKAVRISIAGNQPELAGQTVGDIAEARASDPVDTVCDILLADNGHTRILVESMSETDVQEILASPMVTVGSDGNSLATYGITSQGKPHPRFYGTFARVLGRYVRELGVLSMPLAVHKMTGEAAASLQLVDRGTLKEGSWADVVVLDPDQVGERATYDEPHRYAAGFSYVLVNGKVVVDNAEHTGEVPGRVLRRTAKGVA